MKAKREKEAIKIVKSEMARIREMNDDLQLKTPMRNPVEDCLVEVREDHVFFGFDGAGYDYFSYQSQYSSSFREKLHSKLQASGFHAEDNNTWSMSIWDDQE